MKQTIKKIIQSGGKSAILVAFGFALAAGTAVWAYTAPTSIAPNGNVAAPINTGSITQVKGGDIGLINLTASGIATASLFKSQRTTVPANPSSCNGNWVCLLSIFAQNSPMLDILNSATKKGVKIDNSGDAYYFDGTNSPSPTPFPYLYRYLVFDNTGKLDSGPITEILNSMVTSTAGNPAASSVAVPALEDKVVVTDNIITQVRTGPFDNVAMASCPNDGSILVGGGGDCGGIVQFSQPLQSSITIPGTTRVLNSTNTWHVSCLTASIAAINNKDARATAICMKPVKETVKVGVQHGWHLLNYGSYGTAGQDCKAFIKSLVPQYDGTDAHIGVQTFGGGFTTGRCLTNAAGSQAVSSISSTPGTFQGQIPNTGTNVSSSSIQVWY